MQIKIPWSNKEGRKSYVGINNLSDGNEKYALV